MPPAAHESTGWAKAEASLPLMDDTCVGKPPSWPENSNANKLPQWRAVAPVRLAEQQNFHACARSSLESNGNTSGLPIRSFLKSGCRGFTRKFRSEGMIALGTAITPDLSS